MTDLQAQAQHTQCPHLSVETIAYYSGRNAADGIGGRCGFTNPDLIKAWKQGYRSVKAEDRLNMDTEWDRDY